MLERFSAPREYSRPTRAFINLDALRHNAAQLAAHLSGGAKLLAVLKADAYGHGAIQIARALTQTASREYSPNCVAMLGVASVDEGAELREAGIRAPILLLSAILPEEARAAISHDLTPTIFTEELARACDDAARDFGKIADYHFKIDTGMNRLGADFRDAPQLLKTLREYSHLRLGGVYTHFACADEADETMTRAQCERFQKTLRDCGCGDLKKSSRPMLHAANSAAALRYKEMHFDLARTGLALYGLDPRENVAQCDREYSLRPNVSLRPVMTLLSRVTHLKEVRAGDAVSYGATWRAKKVTRVAVVPVGYADGYPRLASGKAQVVIGDTRCEVVGRITMDQMMVDCSRAPKTQIGDEVILFGDSASTRGGENEETISVNEVAMWSQTIPYEVLCGIAARVPRLAVTDDAPREYSHMTTAVAAERDGGSECEDGGDA